MLNSWEELCIYAYISTGNFFTRVLNPLGGAYILSSTDRLFLCITFCCIVICSFMLNHNDAIYNNERRLLKKIYHSIYLQCSKGLCVRGSWRPIITATYIDPHSYGHRRCVFLVLLMLNRRPGGPAECWLALPHLSLTRIVSNCLTSCLDRVI